MAINTTPNLHLPQWTPNEKPSYLVDFNQAFAAIDAGFAGVKEGSDGAVQIATNAYNQATGALQTANQAQASADRITQGLHYSVVNLPTQPGGNLQSLTTTLIYNMAGGLFVIGIITKPEVIQTDRLIGTFTIPATFESAGFNSRNEATNFIIEDSIFLAELNFETSDNHIITIKLNENSKIPPSWYFQTTIPMIGTTTARQANPQYLVFPRGSFA